jgi:hypothetical protein
MTLILPEVNLMTLILPEVNLMTFDSSRGKFNDI